MAALEKRLVVLHGCVDVFKRRVEERLRSTQILNLIAILIEIRQLYDERRTIFPAPLMVRMSGITIPVLDFFVEELTTRATWKRHSIRDSDLEATRRYTERLEREQIEATR